MSAQQRRLLRRARQPRSVHHPIACITETLGTQHLADGVLLLVVGYEEEGIFVPHDAIAALIEDLAYFRANDAHTTTPTA